MTTRPIRAPIDIWPQVHVDQKRPEGGEELRRWNRRKETKERARFLLSTLQKEWPELTAASHPIAPIPIAQAKLESILDTIRTQKPVAYPDIHGMLRAGLNKGARLGWFSGDIPRPLIRVKSAGSPVNSSNFAQVARVSLLREKFIAGIAESLESRGQSTLAGAILISAVLFGQLLDRRKLRQLSRMPIAIQYVRPWLWLNFENTRDAIREGRRGDSSERWVIDSLTANLILRWMAHNDTPLLQVGNKFSNKDIDRKIWSVVVPVLEYLDPGITISTNAQNIGAPAEFVPGNITSITQLTKYSTLSNYLHGAPLLTEVAAGRLENHSLPEHAWLRLITGERLGPPRMPETVGGINPNPVASEHAPVASTDPESGELRQEQYKLLSGFRRILRDASRDRKQKFAVRKTIQGFIKHNHQAACPVMLLLLQWGGYRLSKSGGGIKPSTLDRYLTAMGVPFVDFFGARAVTHLSNQDFIDIYEAVRDSGRTPAEMKLRADLCSVFHQWLEGQGLVEQLDVAGEIGGGLVRDKNVDANVLTYLEYKNTLQRFRDKKENGVPYCDQALLFTILGYRLGLRQSELFGLRAAHFSITKDRMLGDVFIHSGKTANAKRILPFRVLIPSSSEQQDLLNALDSPTSKDWLLHEPGMPDEPANKTQVIDLVVTTMREATGDGSVHIHHLRHSHITWIYFTLLPSIDFLGTLMVAWKQEQPDERSLLERQVAIFEEEIGYRSTTRKTPHAIAIDAGHASPDIGLYSYAHLIDVALFAAGERRLKRLMPTKKLCSLLGVSDGNLRAIRSRLKPRDNLELLVLHAMKELPSQAKQKLCPDLSRFPEWVPPPPTSRLAMIAAALREIDSGSSPDMVGQRYGFPNQSIENWHKSAIQIENLLKGPRGGKHLAASNKQKKHLLPVYGRNLSKKEWLFADQVFGRLREMMRGHEKAWAASMIEIALKQGFGGHNLLLFDDPVVAADFVKFAGKLGVNQDRLIFELRPHKPNSESFVEEDLATWCGALNVEKERVFISTCGYSGLSKIHGDLGIQVASADYPNDVSASATTESTRRRKGGPGFWTAIRFYCVFKPSCCPLVEEHVDGGV